MEKGFSWVIPLCFSALQMMFSFAIERQITVETLDGIMVLT